MTARLDAAPVAMPIPGGRLTTAISTITTAQQLAERAVAAWRNRTAYITTIDSGDDLYPAVAAAVLDRLGPSNRRSIELVTDRSNVARPENADHTPAPVRWIYEGSRQSVLTLNGHRIKISIDDGPPAGTSAEMFQPRRRLRLIASNTAGRDAVHAFLLDVANEHRVRRPEIRIASRWGHWESRGDLPHRELDTVILDDGQRHTLVADLQQFLDDEPAYNRLGVPYHRGYLFHGPPGTGKTSFARALAAHFRLSIYYLAVGDLNSDTDLLSLVSNVPARSILLLEDVDIAHAARERDDTAKSASLAALLNALDGVFTPHGLIKILTTNHREALDPAVVRPGRVDVEATFRTATREQLDGLWRLAFDDVAPRALDDCVGLAPAHVVTTFLKHRHSPTDALRALLGHDTEGAAAMARTAAEAAP